MRNVIMWNLVTLDGRFEGKKPWDLDSHNDVWGEELERLSIEQLDSADALLFGRATYEGMAAHWPKAKGEIARRMNAIEKVVFTRTLRSADWNNTRLVNRDPAEEVVELKKRPGKAMLVFGSARMSESLMRAKLIDEYRICVVPRILGVGRTLFPVSDERVATKLKLLRADTTKTGAVILRYVPAAGGEADVIDGRR